MRLKNCIGRRAGRLDAGCFGGHGSAFGGA